MKTTKRLVAILSIIVFVFNIAMASLFIIEKSHHFCSGDKCSVCSQLQNANDTINSSKVEKATISFAFFLLIVTIASLVVEVKLIKPYTLTSLKVKLTA